MKLGKRLLRREVYALDSSLIKEELKSETLLKCILYFVSGKVTTHQRLKGILNFLDNMVLDDESLGLYYDSVRQLHTIFWDLKDKKNSAAQPTAESGSENTTETLSSALNFLVVHEWPKVMLGCFKKLKAAYPHVFVEETSPEVLPLDDTQSCLNVHLTSMTSI